MLIITIFSFDIQISTHSSIYNIISRYLSIQYFKSLIWCFANIQLFIYQPMMQQKSSRYAIFDVKNFWSVNEQSKLRNQLQYSSIPQRCRICISQYLLIFIKWQTGDDKYNEWLIKKMKKSLSPGLLTPILQNSSNKSMKQWNMKWNGIPKSGTKTLKPLQYLSKWFRKYHNSQTLEMIQFYRF